MAADNDVAAKAKAKVAVQGIFDLFFYIADRSGYAGFDQKLMKDVKLLDAGPEGSAVFELYISDYYSNLNGVMHGGAAGVIFDMCTTVALGPISKPGYWDFLGGVSRNLNISYLRALPIGTTVHIRSRVVQHGRTMAMIKGEMVSPDGKITYTTVEHHKVHLPSKKEHLDGLETMKKKLSSQLRADMEEGKARL